MAIAVEMPKMSDTMEEGVLVAWLAEEGASVSAGDVIAQVETDKATMDLEVYDDGVLLKRVVGEGDSVPIGALIAVLGKEGESADDVIGQYGGDGAAGDAAEVQAAPPATDEGNAAPAGLDGIAPVAEAIDAPAPSVQPVGGDGAAPSATPAASSADGDRVKASPLARRMATEGGLDLATVQGSGPDGRVVKRDVEAALAGTAQAKAPAASAPAPVPTKAPASAAQPVSAGGQDVRITQMRKTIAKRLAQSKFTAPHFYLTVDVDMSTAIAFRGDINALTEAQGLAKVSYNDLITKASAVALGRHPMVNASYLEDEGVIRQHDGAHVAVAVAMPEGLITPVVRDADRKGLAAIAAETRELAGRARDGKLDPAEYSGSTFTTSNLGMFGISEFTAIINPPNACILAIGAIRDVPVVKDGAVVPGQVMTLTLSCDHRVVDGASGAAFLGDVKAMLESPSLMLV
ncbi:pyruvate dehydrogenase complex dihydrolipoamide acetyltransferase [Rubrivirga sp. IMCC45206]|uniref:pyruvate dehydrogenase complex dihydrolipoamide acetyltransferase n=1 Tax=Rubrivirga sp. IMCC45206 TaxID=3391614 RepID=UPI00398F9163